MRRMMLMATATAALLGATPVIAAEYKLSALEALTGPYAFAGVGLDRGQALAAEEINASGLLGPGNSIKYTGEDGASDRTQAVTLVSRFANDKDTLVIFGPTAAPDVLASGPIAVKAGIPMMTNAGTPAVFAVGPFVYKITESTDDFMTTLANFAVDKLGVRNCAFVTVNDSESYMRQRDVLKSILLAHGGKVAADESVRSSDTNFAAIATKVIDRTPDCLAINTPAEQTVSAIVQFKQAGLPDNVKIVLNNTAASTTFLKAGGPSVAGSYIITSFISPGATEQARKFTESYTRKYGSEPDDWGALGYSAMQAVAYAIKAAQPNVTRERVGQEIAKLKDVPIVAGSGRLSIGPDRNPHYGMTVLTVRDGKFVAP